MVNVAQYQLVAVAPSVLECEDAYVALLASQGITQPEELPQTQVSGQVAEIRSAVLDGNTYYYLRLEGEEIFYALSAKDNPIAVILNPGDQVTITHAPLDGEAAEILSGYTLTLDRRGQTPVPTGTGQADPSPAPSPSGSPAL